MSLKSTRNPIKCGKTASGETVGEFYKIFILSVFSIELSVARVLVCSCFSCNSERRRLLLMIQKFYDCVFSYAISIYKYDERKRGNSIFSRPPHKDFDTATWAEVTRSQKDKHCAILPEISF